MTTAGRSALLRAVLVLGYFVLAHAAGVGRDPRLAALALADLALLLLLPALLARRAWAFAALVPAAVGLAFLARSTHALLPLLLVPAAIVALVGYGFGRTLRAGRTPLITRIVAAMDGIAPAQLAPELLRYTRTLTLLWAVLLASLALFNLALAALVVPAGLLAGLGIAPPVAVSEAQWSWCANVGNYGLIVGFLLLEFGYRKRRFPGRYRNFLHFLQKMARLGPAFWQGVLRSP
jgi:uncharacterized membrane protein